MKKLLNKILAGALTLAMCVSFAACQSPENPPEGVGNGDGTATTYVGIDINPSVELTLDESGIVVSVYGANEDGQILLWEEENAILGKNYEAAVEYITALAVDLGYLSEDNTDVSTTVDGANADTIKNKISAKIEEKAGSLGVSVTVDFETAFEILRELEALKAEYPDNTAIQALTPDKYKLAVRASEGGEITITAAAELDTAALIEKVKTTHNTIEKYATDAYLAAKAKANAIFDSSVGILIDGVYTQVYVERAAKILSNPAYLNTIHLGAMYQAYKTTERTYLALSEIMKFADEYTSLAIDEALVAEIATELGISDVAPLRDEAGNITIKSVSEYCNKLLHQNELGTEAESAINEILDEAEDAAQLVMMAGETYRAELNALKTSIQTVISTVSATSSALIVNNPVVSADVKAEFAACLEELNAAGEKLADIIENGATEDEIKALAKEASLDAAAVLERIEADLTEDEKASVNTRIEALNTQMQSLKNSFNQALEAAENEAKSYIEDKRNERKNQSEE